MLVRFSFFVCSFVCLFAWLNMSDVARSHFHSFLIRQYQFRCAVSVTIGAVDEGGTKADLTTEGTTGSKVKAPATVRFSRSCGCNLQNWLFGVIALVPFSTVQL